MVFKEDKLPKMQMERKYNQRRMSSLAIETKGELLYVSENSHGRRKACFFSSYQ